MFLELWELTQVANSEKQSIEEKLQKLSKKGRDCRI